MVFIQSNDRKGRYEFRAIQESCKMRSVYKNEIRAKQENNDTCKSVIHTQHLPYWYGTHLWHVAMLTNYALSLINPSTPTVPV